MLSTRSRRAITASSRARPRRTRRNSAQPKAARRCRASSRSAVTIPSRFRCCVPSTGPTAPSRSSTLTRTSTLVGPSPPSPSCPHPQGTVPAHDASFPGRPKVFGGSPSQVASINHGTYFYHASQEGLLRNDSNIHAGIRTTLSGPSDYENDGYCGFEIVEARELDTIGTDGSMQLQTVFSCPFGMILESKDECLLFDSYPVRPKRNSW